MLRNVENILLINPLNYPDFIWMMNRAKIITDSGGIQEAPSLGKPVLVMKILPKDLKLLMLGLLYW